MKPTSIKFNKASFSLTLISAATAVWIGGCAPAKWSEANGNSGSNSTSGSPDPGARAPSAKTANEVFTQEANANQVDILIVNDNSASMDEEQTKMANRFTSFVSDLKGIDYRIAMTTTDIETAKWRQDGRIMAWSGTTAKVLTPSTSDAEGKFQKSIRRAETIGCVDRGDCPSPNEQPLRAIELAVDQAKTANKDLFRDGVDFVVVVLSDEDEMSTGPANATTAAHVAQHFKDVFGTTKRLAVHGLVVEPGDDKCLALQRAQGPEGSKSAYATHVASLASLTGGSVHSICDYDYAKDLAAISTSVRKLISSFELKDTPRSGSVNVTLTPAFKTTWSIENNSLVFNPAPPAGTKIEVSYLY